MDTGRIYRDNDGNECSLLQIVQFIPGWAVIKIQELEAEIAEALKAKGMISLEEHNEKRENWHRSCAPNAPMPNGIACPECGKELFDTNPSAILCSMPPKKNVDCECGYTGYRVA